MLGKLDAINPKDGPEEKGIVETFDECGAFYIRKEGTNMPFVEVAKTYSVDAEERHYVSNQYLNFREALKNLRVLEILAQRMVEKLAGLSTTKFFGAPTGGCGLAKRISEIRNQQQGGGLNTSINTWKTRFNEESDGIDYQSDQINDGDKIVLVEDVCNQFSTTKEILRLFKKQEKKVKIVTVICILNRSENIENILKITDYPDDIPVIYLERMPTVIYKQEDNCVAKAVTAGTKIIKNPKENWKELKEAMWQAEPEKNIHNTRR